MHHKKFFSSLNFSNFLKNCCRSLEIVVDIFHCVVDMLAHCCR